MKSLDPKQLNSYKQIFGIVVNFTHQNLFVFDSSKTGNKFHAQFILQNGGGVNMILLEIFGHVYWYYFGLLDNRNISEHTTYLTKIKMHNFGNHAT